MQNSVPLPLKTTQERVSELRMQFPVSSGQQHRRTETEWVPVSPKKVETTTTTVTKPVETTTVAQIAHNNHTTAAVVQTTPATAPGPQVFPPISKPDVNSMVL